MLLNSLACDARDVAGLVKLKLSDIFEKIVELRCKTTNPMGHTFKPDSRKAQESIVFFVFFPNPGALRWEMVLLAMVGISVRAPRPRPS